MGKRAGRVSVKLKGGTGYWETDFYPIGGSFRRAPKTGKEIKEVKRRINSKLRGAHGCDIEVIFTDGSTGATSAGYIELEPGDVIRSANKEDDF